MQQAQNPDCHSDLVNFLVGICNVLYEQKNADIVIKQYANTLQKNRDILKGFQDEKILVKYIKNLKEMHLDDVARETFVDIKYIAVAQALE